MKNRPHTQDSSIDFIEDGMDGGIGTVVGVTDAEVKCVEVWEAVVQQHNELVDVVNKFWVGKHRSKGCGQIMKLEVNNLQSGGLK